MGKYVDFIFGLRPVIEAIREGRQIDRLLLKHNLQGQLFHELIREAAANDIPYQFVPVERINLHTRKNHQGVIAFISPVEYQKIENILPAVFEKGEDPLIICLDGVSDVRNFGAVVRSASCLGAHAVLIPSKGAARISADAVKTSAGALNNFPVCRVKSITAGIEFLKQSGLKVISADEKSNLSLFDANLSGPVVLIMGSEERGISGELLKISDLVVKIPVTGQIGSLNVSVAAGILLYEIKRQRFMHR